MRDCKKDADDPLADLPFWLVDFTENLEPTEVRAPAHIYQDSDSEHPTKVVTKSRKHSIYNHFPKNRNCGVCLRTKMTKSSCRRRTVEAPLREEKFCDLIMADHKVFNEVNPETINDTPWCKILLLSVFNLIRARQRLHTRRNKVC